MPRSQKAVEFRRALRNTCRFAPYWLSSGDSLWISKYNHNRVSFQTRLASCSEAPGRPGLDPGPLMPVEQRSGRDPVHSQVIRYSRNSND
jgi:hypothetical protein